LRSSSTRTPQTRGHRTSSSPSHSNDPTYRRIEGTDNNEITPRRLEIYFRPNGSRDYGRGP